ncbi:MAG: HesA/MoeB/ThiF family protein [Promethearchaeota archaeon]
MDRYARQVIIPEIGKEGQEKLEKAKVVVVGTGGLGSPALAYLAAAGVGTLRLVDGDEVESSNLNRQILHFTSDIGKRKVRSARETLEQMNPGIQFEQVDAYLTGDNAKETFKGMDYVVDASDNFKTKFLVNDTAVTMGIPCTVGGVVRWDGQMMSVVPGKSACYRCVFTDVPPEGSLKPPSELGIIGVSAGLLGTIAATECIKYLLEFPVEKRLINRLMMVDLRSWDFTLVTIKKSKSCKVCSTIT